MNVTCGICILSPASCIPLPADSSTWVSNVRLRRRRVRNVDVPLACSSPIMVCLQHCLCTWLLDTKDLGAALPSSPSLPAGRQLACLQRVGSASLTSAPRTPSSLPRPSLLAAPTPSSVRRHRKGLPTITALRSPAQTRQPRLVALSAQPLPSPWPGRPPTLPRSPRGAWSPRRAGSALRRAAGSFPSPGLCTCRLQSFPWALAWLPPLVIRSGLLSPAPHPPRKQREARIPSRLPPTVSLAPRSPLLSLHSLCSHFLLPSQGSINTGVCECEWLSHV